MSESVTSAHFPNAFYRVSTKALIRKGNHVLFNWEEEEGYYALPGGGLDWGESVHEGLMREIKEETGYKVLKIAKKPNLRPTSHRAQ